MKKQSLKEIIDFSKEEISDLIIEHTKFGDILNHLQVRKPNNKYITQKKSSSIMEKKFSIREIIEEDSLLEDKADKEDLFLEQMKSSKLNYNSSLILKSEESEIKLNNDKIYQNESFIDLTLKSCESSKEFSSKLIEDIFNFIDSEENDIQKYLIDNKIIEEQNLNEKNEEEDLYSLTEEDSYHEENEENKDIIKEIKNEKENELKIIKEEGKKEENNNENNIKKDLIIINKSENRTNNNEVNNGIDNSKNDLDNINCYKNTKLPLIEKTENYIFLKEKDKSELNQFITSNNKIPEDTNKTEKETKNKIIYEITEFYSRNKLSQEFMNMRITCLFCYGDYIYLGDGGGNLLIYSLTEEKLIKQLKNLLPIENNRKLSINSIHADENYIIAGYERGKVVVYVKDIKNLTKTKIFETFLDITKEDIIETKIYSKKNNVIIIYCADSQERIFRIKIKKNKLFKNTITGSQITGPLKNSEKKSPYYNIEINPFFYKCIGVVNNDAVDIYIVKHFKKNVIYASINEKEDFFINFCFSVKKEEKNKFYICNCNKIKINEINDDYTGAAQLNTIILGENIIQIGHFNTDIIYAYTEKNNIKLINFDDKTKSNESLYGFSDTISIDKNDINKNNSNNADFLIDFKNHISIKNGRMFFYYQNKILYLKTLPFYDGLNKLYNNIFITNNNDIYDALFKIIIEINKKKHLIWKNNNPVKLKELCIIYSQSYISSLIVQLGNKKTEEDFFLVKNKFNKLIQFLFDMNYQDLIINDQKSLYVILCENKLKDLYFFLLEPFILDDKFLENKNIKSSFIIDLMNCYLNKTNVYLIKSKSWLSEILLHFPINNILLLEPEIKKNYLINVVFYIVMHSNFDTTKTNFDYCTPMDLIMQLLSLRLPVLDLNEEALFVKENRFKDEIAFSNDYLRLKIIWYIAYILKNKIPEKKSIKESKLKTSFIQEVFKILFDDNNFNLIAFNELGNEKRNKNSIELIKEVLYVFQLILDDVDNLNKYYEINKNTVFQQIKDMLGKRKESQIDLNLFIIKNIIKDNSFEIRDDEKFNLVLYFMENNIENSALPPEQKVEQLEMNLIEILKLINDIKIEHSEKLLKTLDKCKGHYKQLEKYILANFKGS